LQEDADGDGKGDVCDPFFDITGDIKLGSDPNSVNCKNNKGLLKSVVPIVFFGSDDLDVMSLDIETIKINGDKQEEKHGKIHFEDVNSDGKTDAVFHLKKKLVCDSVPDMLGVHVATVTATGGVIVGFVDSINIVQTYNGGGGGGDGNGGPDKTPKEIEKAKKKFAKIKDSPNPCKKILNLHAKVIKKGIHDDVLDIHDYLDLNCGGH